MPEQGLHPGQGSVRSLVLRTRTAPQRLLVGSGGHGLDRYQPQPGYAAGGSRCATEPSFELPPNPVEHVYRA